MRFKDVRLEGLEEFQKAIEALGTAATKRIIRNAARAGAVALLKGLKAETPRPGADHEYATGALLRSARNKELRQANTASRTQLVGFRRPDGAHVHLVDEGTDPHEITRDGETWQHPGAKAKPFFGRGINRGRPSTADAVRKVIESGLKREALKAAAPKRVSTRVQRGG